MATLSNLVTASKTHATSLGILPIRLLDAATSNTLATVTEIGRMVCIRRRFRCCCASTPLVGPERVLAGFEGIREGQICKSPEEAEYHEYQFEFEEDGRGLWITFCCCIQIRRFAKFCENVPVISYSAASGGLKETCIGAF